MADDRVTTHDNRDPITNEPGAHPVGTGVGATGGAIAGAAAGAIGGPIGLAVGGVAGAVVGGLAGKAAAESVNPTEEEAYWRNNYTREPYFEAGRNYTDYGPAYELGWSYRARHGDDFDTQETALASGWETLRGASSLSWDQARHATRAAWDRADRTYYADDMVGADDDLDDDDVVDTLNDLIEICGDGEQGFHACAEHAGSPDLQAVFQKRAEECTSAAAELRGHVVRLGGEPNEGGSVSGALHRGWVALRNSLSGHADVSLLDECERGEDHALAAYRKALRQTLPPAVRSVVQRQADGAQRNHDQIKALRDQARSRS